MKKSISIVQNCTSRTHISPDAESNNYRIDTSNNTALTILQIHAMRECMNYVDVQADKCQNKLKWRVIPEDFRYRSYSHVSC